MNSVYYGIIPAIMNRILTASADANSVEELRKVSEGLFEFRTAADGVDALNAMRNECFDCIILDSDIPGVEAEKLIEFLHNSRISASVPLIMLTQNDNAEFVAKSGCTEILLKPLEPAYARKRLENVLMLAKLKRNIAEYRQKMDTDPMTGLLSKAGFQKKVRKLLNHGTRGAMLMCGMDGLKYINDNFSRSEGDRILMSFAECLQDTMPADSLIAHISGDEFCVFIPELTERGAVSDRCAELAAAIGARIRIPDGSRLITASVGIAFCPEDASTYDNLSAMADHALLYVKNHGRGTFRFHEHRDEREQMLKGRQECTNLSTEIMLRKRSGEEIQTWLKFGEFRVIYIAYERYTSESLDATLCLLNLVDLDSPRNPDSKKIMMLNRRVTEFLKDAQFPGIFSWYSINQLLILTLEKGIIPAGITRLCRELADEMNALHLDIDLIL